MAAILRDILFMRLKLFARRVLIALTDCAPRAAANPPRMVCRKGRGKGLSL